MISLLVRRGGKSRWSIAVMLFASVSLALQSAAALALSLGGMNYSSANPAVPHIVNFAPGPRFFRVSGGVALTQTATGKDGWVLTDLKYNPNSADGTRFFATFVRSHTAVNITLSMRDWEMVPLVRFVAADKENRGQSAITLFGELKNKVRDREVKSRGNMVINYHPAFENTLLGLRLLQADLLLIDRRAAELFREGDTDILGGGEPRPDGNFIKIGRDNFDAVSKWRNESGIEFVSYVAGDIGQPIQFEVSEGKLRIWGAPRWVLWRNPESSRDAMNRQAEAMMMSALAQLPLQDARLAIALEHDKLINLLVLMKDAGVVVKGSQEESKINEATKQLTNQFEALYKAHPEGARFLASNGTYQPGPNARLTLCYQLYERLSALTDAERARLESKIERSLNLSQLSRQQQDLPVEVDEQASNSISQKIAESGGINAIVYRSLVRSVRYAALLRHYRLQSASGFEKLVASVRSADIRPEVPAGLNIQTPTIYPRGRDLR